MASSQSVHQDGRRNIVIQVAGSNNAVSVRSGDALPLHGVSQNASAVPIRTETDILKPRCQAVSFLGRENELAGVRQWLHSSNSFSIRTLVGPGGSGKTRLGIEVLRRMLTHMPDWQAGFLDHEELRECSGHLNQRDFEWEKPTLMVLDYAASCVEPLKTIVRKFRQQLEEPDYQGYPMRVLLLERFADTETGWLSETIDRSFGGDSAAYFEPVVHLTAFGDLEQRYEVLRQTVARGAAFHPGQAFSVPVPGSSPQLDERLREPKCADPLVLMMAALTAFSTGWTDAFSYSRADLAMRVAQREAERIKRCARDRSNENLLLHMAAYATLCSSLSGEVLVQSADGELRALTGQYAGGARGLAQDLTKALPGAGGAVGVSPDIVGEAFVIHVLGMQFQDAAGTVRRAVAQEQSAIAVVIRAVVDFHHAGHPGPRLWLSEVVKVAKEAKDSPALLYAIEHVLPNTSVELRELSVEVTQALVGWLDPAIIGWTGSDPFNRARARLRRVLAGRLSALGRNAEALVQAEESVRLCRQLAAVSPDVYAPDLASALNTFGNRLSDLGRDEEALPQTEEAVSIRRQLADARPHLFLSDLAFSLSNLANHLNSLGRHAEALYQANEGVRLRRQLAAEHPAEISPDLATSVSNLALILVALGRHEEAVTCAEESVQSYRRAAAASPDAFVPGLASSLHNYSYALSYAGRFHEALAPSEEAVRLFQQLATVRPEAFLSELLDPISQLVEILTNLERLEEALVWTQDAIRLYRQLAPSNPDGFLRQIAGSFHNLAALLSRLGRQKEALFQAAESVCLYRQLAVTHPKFLPDLSRALARFGALQESEDQVHAAATTFHEALSIVAPLMEGAPDTFASLASFVCDHYFKNVIPARLELDEDLVCRIILAQRKQTQGEE